MGQCMITDAGLANTACNNDNGTTTDQCDDYTSFDLTVQNNGDGTCVATYSISVSSGTISPTTGTFGVLESFEIISNGTPDTVIVSIDDGVSPTFTFEITCCDPPNSSTSNTTGCQVSLIDSANNGNPGGAGFNGNDDCTPCSMVQEGSDSDAQQFCGMVYIDLIDILGEDVTCANVSVQASTGGIYNFYQGTLICAGTCPGPYAVDIPNNQTVTFTEIDMSTIECGLFPILVCAQSGGGARSLDVTAFKCCPTDSGIIDISQN